MKIISIVTNPKSDSIKEVLEAIVDTLEKYNITILFDMYSAGAIGEKSTSYEEIINLSDMVIALGGDGTVLYAAQLLSGKTIPILGIYMGRLGFITAFDRSEITHALTEAIEGRLPISKRMRLECRLERGGEIVYEGSVLNEVSIHKLIGRIISFDVLVNNEKLSSYRADGFLVATPTGSTGYSLAAGGSIVQPDMELILLSPLSPHLLSIRDVIVPATSEIKLMLTQESEDIYLLIDGKTAGNILYGDTLFINKSEVYTILYDNPLKTFYEHLRIKFGWGQPEC